MPPGSVPARGVPPSVSAARGVTSWPRPVGAGTRPWARLQRTREAPGSTSATGLADQVKTPVTFTTPRETTPFRAGTTPWQLVPSGSDAARRTARPPPVTRTAKGPVRASVGGEVAAIGSAAGLALPATSAAASGGSGHGRPEPQVLRVAAPAASFRPRIMAMVARHGPVVPIETGAPLVDITEAGSVARRVGSETC